MSMSILEILQGKGFSFRKVGSSEYAGECPFCGGKDRFRVWPDKGEFGKFWCRGCGKSGDSIEFLRMQGMSYPEACAAIGKELNPVKSGNGWKPKFSTPKEKWLPIHIEGPKDSWQKKACAFVDTAHFYLLRNSDALAWLADARGISLETVRTVRLGWNEKDTWIAREAWGLPEALKEDGTPKKLWLPGGLVIPTFAGDLVARVRVRRLEGEPRYVVVSGSAMFPMVRGNEGPVVIVESELDAVLIEQEMQGLVRTVALGSVTIRPDDTTAAMISKAPIVLISLDADEAGEQNSWTFWKANFPHARVWPVPVGKDPTDFFLAGGSIKAWIDAASYKPVSDELNLNEIEKEYSRKNFVFDTKVDPTEDEILETMKTLN